MWLIDNALSRFSGHKNTPERFQKKTSCDQKSRKILRENQKTINAKEMLRESRVHLKYSSNAKILVLLWKETWCHRESRDMSKLSVLLQIN